MIEVEIKIKIDGTKTREKLEKMGFYSVLSLYEKDTYFNSSLNDLKASDKALRIREYKDLDLGINRYILNFKGPKLDNVTMSREETEFEIPSFRHGHTLLSGLGYSEAGIVEKTRNVLKKGDISCCLDDVKGLGEFLEIEIMTDTDGYLLALSRIEHILNNLGLSMTDTTNESYLCMFQRKGDIDG